jgi:pyruvate formate lyase activating enzyme
VPPFKTPLDVLSPQLVRDAVASAVSTGCHSISFTYSEPSVSMELIRSVAPLARDTGLETIMVSNGYSSWEAMASLAPLISAANFDLKSFSDDFYRRLCRASLVPVLRTIAQAVAYGWWVEVTTLLIPGRNDSDKELTRIARFIKEDLGAHVPWHISRFRPIYKMRDVQATPVASLERAHSIGLAEDLRFVYIGNVAGHDAENTFCPECGELFIQREGYRISSPLCASCAFCGAALPGVWGKV